MQKEGGRKLIHRRKLIHYNITNHNITSLLSWHSVALLPHRRRRRTKGSALSSNKKIKVLEQRGGHRRRRRKRKRRRRKKRTRRGKHKGRCVHLRRFYICLIA
jgi:hypothetical protein